MTCLLKVSFFKNFEAIQPSIRATINKNKNGSGVQKYSRKVIL